MSENVFEHVKKNPAKRISLTCKLFFSIFKGFELNSWLGMLKFLLLVLDRKYQSKIYFGNLKKFQHICFNATLYRFFKTIQKKQLFPPPHSYQLGEQNSFTHFWRKKTGNFFFPLFFFQFTHICPFPRNKNKNEPTKANRKANNIFWRALPHVCVWGVFHELLFLA